MVLIIPIPPVLLDLLLTINISLSIVVLLAIIYIQRPVDFSVFPSLLLILTLFRLSLNVASTRLILRDADAGMVIAAFGGFVTGNNYVVGFIIFSILVVIQFVVITKGAGRISEVTARFTLDAMPGKQMGVDADLNAGLITEEQARERRQGIESEANFYGAMDGATKFVRGDAIAGIIITVVNIIGGLIIGVMMQGFSVAEAAAVYTKLTVGDGLVSQVPALIISTSAALLVTRTASDTNLGADFAKQLTRFPRALGIAACMLCTLGMVPGLPFAPFAAVGALLGVMAYQTTKHQRHALEVASAAEIAREEDAAPEAVERAEDLLVVDPLKIELGYGLISLADPKQGGDLLTRIQIIRQQTAARMGFVVPVIRIVDNMRLRPNEYAVKLRESVVARYELLPDHFLAMNPGLVEEEIEGIPTEEPAFHLQAMWVSKENRDHAERLGYTLVEPTAVLATHLTEIIVDHMPGLITRQNVQTLVDKIREDAPSVVEELLPNVLTLGEVHNVLKKLLAERVSIRNLEQILEVLADNGPKTKDVELLTEYVRQALARQICGEHSDEDDILRVVTLAPDLEREILNSVRQTEAGAMAPIEPERANEIATNTVEAVQPLVLAGQEPIVLCSAHVRRYFKKITNRQMPRLIVLSYDEIDASIELESEGQVRA